MCYLIAKDRDVHGCFALKTKHGKHLAELKRELDRESYNNSISSYHKSIYYRRKLNRAVGYKGVQLVTISRPTAYGEYAPYCFVDTEKEFETLVKSLR